MVDEVMKKATATVLAVALLFAALVPVPSGLGALDRVRCQRAYANAGTIAELGYEVFLTALAAAGVYVACDSLEEYGTNGNLLYSDFNSWLASNNDGQQSAVEAELQAAVDAAGVNVSLGSLQQSGFYDLLQDYLQSSNAAALLEAGGASNAGTRNCSYTYDGKNFPATVSVPHADVMASTTQAMLANGKVLVAYRLVSTYSDGSTYWEYYYSTEPVAARVQNGSGGSKVLYLDHVDMRGKSISREGVASGSNYSSSNISINIWSDDAQDPYKQCIGVANRQYQLSGGDEIGFVNTAAKPGIYTPELVSQRIGEIASGAIDMVHIFQPTAEQLEEGYNYQTVIEAELGGISTGIEGLDHVLNLILGVLEGIASIASAPFAWLASWWAQLTGWWAELLSWIRATPLGQFCADVTAWLGSTPFGNIAATVIDGVQAIPGAVAGAGQAVLEGVQAIPGAISGTLEGILEGVQAIPGAVVGAISAVGTAVDAISGAIATVMEFIEGGFTFDALPVVAPPNWMEELEVDLSDKVPFCYVIRSYHALGDMFGNFSNNRSFYLEMEIPEAGVVTMDGEQVLGLSFGLLDIATTIRILFTSLLCFGLLYRAYKIIERTANSL